MPQEEARHRDGRPLSSAATAHEASEALDLIAQDRPSDGFWHTTLGTIILSAIENLFAEELSEIQRAREDRELALKASEYAQREVALLQNSLAACEAALADLPHETSRAPHGSNDGAAVGSLKERERLSANQGRLRIRLIEAKAHAAKVATNERQETDRFARRARRAHARAKAKRGEVHAHLEQTFKEVDDKLGEAWFVALAFGEQERSSSAAPAKE